MSDIVTILRENFGVPRTQDICNRAADEIDRLRRELLWLRDNTSDPLVDARVKAALGATVQPAAVSIGACLHCGGPVYPGMPHEVCDALLGRDQPEVIRHEHDWIDITTIDGPPYAMCSRCHEKRPIECIAGN